MGDRRLRLRPHRRQPQIRQPEIVGFWTPEYLESKLDKIRQADADNLILAISERLDCADEDFGETAERVLWFKTGIHVYDMIDLVEEFTE